jgi:undecaprenyl-diphosphatase
MFLEILKAIIYGIVEGITEWLPVSSTGHLILLEQLLPLKASDAFMEMFDVVIQLGAILAVIVLFFHKLNPFSPKKSPAQKRKTWELWLKVIVAVIPSVILGLLLDDWMDEHLYNHVVVAIALIVYGVAFILVERRNQGKTPAIRSTGQLSYKTALLVGCFQVLALVPGTSRSGATILGAILLGMSRTAGAEFSFFLAIPTMLGASALKVLKFLLEGSTMSGSEWACLIVASLVAFVVSLLAIRSLMDYVKKHSFSAFGVYRIILGALVLLVYLFTRG